MRSDTRSLPRWATVAVVVLLAGSACSDSALDETSAGATGGEATSAEEAVTTDASAGDASAENGTGDGTGATDADTEADDGGSATETGTGSETGSEPTGSGCGLEVATGRSTVSFEFEDRTRVYELVVPSSYLADEPMPLVMNWHGLGSNGPDQLGFSEYPALAEEEGFLVVAPTGVPVPGQTANSWELTDDDDPTRDDLAFAEAVLDRVIATVCVDEARVYTTGMSNGGYFSSRLVCELADRIAGAASVAALNHPDDCEPSRPVPYVGFHGVDDEIVPYDGGGFSSLFPGVQIELFESVIPDEFAEFASTFGCNPAPAEEQVSADVTSFEYQGCPDDIEVVFYELDNAGHTWPGSTISASISRAAGLGITNTDINASELSWELFSRHSLS